MSVWPHAIAFVLEEEGEDSSHPADHGGHTRFGISSAAHPGIDVRNLTMEEAQRLYYERYWLPIRGPEMPAPVAVALFDWCVHSGPGRAVRRLQRLLGLSEDGVVGEKTLAAVRSQRPMELARRLVLARARHQNTLIDADPTQAVFRDGWQARLIRLSFFVAGLG